MEAQPLPAAHLCPVCNTLGAFSRGLLSRQSRLCQRRGGGRDLNSRKHAVPEATVGSHLW